VRRGFSIGGQQGQSITLRQVSRRHDNSAASSGRPRRCRSASRWQTSVTASDGMTNRDQFSRRNAVQRTWSRSAALNAATSGPVSHKIMLTRPVSIVAIGIGEVLVMVTAQVLRAVQRADEGGQMLGQGPTIVSPGLLFACWRIVAHTRQSRWQYMPRSR
jgi:hypothetical protein